LVLGVLHLAINSVIKTAIAQVMRLAVVMRVVAIVRIPRKSVAVSPILCKPRWVSLMLGSNAVAALHVVVVKQLVRPLSLGGVPKVIKIKRK
jgi:hypothetical protein